jgi:putative ABC transport system permease protein
VNLWLGIVVGLKEIAAHKFRSALTMLGIILGVCSLVGMFALVAGMTSGMKSALNEMGGLEKVNVTDQEPPPAQAHLAGLSPGRTMTDVAAIRANCPLIETISPEVDLRGATAVRGNKSTRPRQVVGATPAFMRVNNFDVEFGRFIADVDVATAARVCVIGSQVRDELFPGTPAPLGERVEINGEMFTVVGVARLFETERARKMRLAGRTESRPSGPRRTGPPGRRWNWFAAKNEVIVMPLTTMQLVFKSGSINSNDADPKLTYLNLRVADAERLNEALQQVKNVLLFTHRGVEDFGFDTRENWADSIREQNQNAVRTGGLIASISLVVGGIGIMNIMLASISERIHEIGIRKAVGARDRDIFVQILVESTTLAWLGGLVGLACAFGLVELLARLAPFDFTPVVTGRSLLVSLCFSVGVGVLAGLYPALKASRFHPIEALRYE